MKIGKVKTTSNIFLAPMAGITDIAFRSLCKAFGAGLTYTEMISVKGLFYKSKNTEKLLKISDNERPCAVQLFGSEPHIFFEVIKSGVLDKFDIIDINMGCPAAKIVKNNEGSALLKDFIKASEIIKSCVSITDKPITVKIRKGFEKNSDILIEFAKMCEESGASAIVVHPRTRADFFSGGIDTKDIEKVKKAVKIPVIANGGVVDKCTYEHMLKTGCDAVMIGRGAIGNPEIFSVLQNKKVEKTKYEIICEHLKLLEQNFDSSVIVKKFKKHLLAYLSGYKNIAEFKRKIVLTQDLKEMKTLIDNFFIKD